ncbi:RNA polymerase [Sporanaerobium hydrogeniformans]|uniref:RNA polymerase n=1 Tax=Sporanaerobium hydrogeniformans TaxID=3072179 RepID=A0AC61DCL3_9FIRM|nr:sigma-70 family RNA polymerase sigma factor [Sporanaerobium hydrogeniformans]PHV71059.1 RNA polymerase [Sporanaerobium hydrogeniformans]
MEEARERMLIEKVKSGDMEAFEELLFHYEKPIYTICLRLLKDEEEAMDAAQEVALKLWKQLHLFKYKSKLSTWIYRLTTNQCLDQLRKWKHKKDISLFQQDTHKKEEWIFEKPDEEISIEKQIEQKELQAILQQALMELKEDYRTILVLRDIQHYAYEEIAEVLNITLGTVKSRLSRARGALKKVLEQNKEPYQSFFRLKR